MMNYNYPHSHQECPTCLRLREENARLRAKLADIEAGCDIQKSHGLYRQVRVIIGPGKIQAEIDRAQLMEALEGLLNAWDRAAALAAAKGE